MIDIYDFIGFAKSQGFNVSYRAKIGEIFIFDIDRFNPAHRVLSTRYDSPENKITWFIQDYDISQSDLENLVKNYKEGLK